MKRTFGTGQAFLDQEAAPCFAEAFFRHHRGDRRLRFLHVRRHNHTFASAKPSALITIGNRDSFRNAAAASRFFEDRRPRCRNPLPSALILSRRSSRIPIGPRILSAQKFGDAPFRSDRRFPPPADHPARRRSNRPHSPSRNCQGRQIARFDRDVLADLLGPRIARRAKNPGDSGRLLQFPNQRVFAATAADDENFHGNAASLGNELKSSAVAAAILGRARLCRAVLGRARLCRADSSVRKPSAARLSLALPILIRPKIAIACYKMTRVFLLSPAYAGGQRARMIMSERAQFDLAQRLRSSKPPTLGEIFAFLSGLYFGESWPTRMLLRRRDGDVRRFSSSPPDTRTGSSREPDRSGRPPRVRRGRTSMKTIPVTVAPWSAT